MGIGQKAETQKYGNRPSGNGDLVQKSSIKFCDILYFSMID
ncbi:MAG: hypothetical protein BroJett018_50800 [Chloroflexota bacterium]|nr:MAG: hypothetical protein BroJett018_50800 [Chloroflexota bacterium]